MAKLVMVYTDEPGDIDAGLLSGFGIRLRVSMRRAARFTAALPNGASAVVVVGEEDDPVFWICRRQYPVPVYRVASGSGVVERIAKEVGVEPPAALSSLNVAGLDALIDERGLEVDKTLKKKDKVAAISEALAGV